jgi:hypothetical protein
MNESIYQGEFEEFIAARSEDALDDSYDVIDAE